jgi:hypothetical protein
MTCVCLYASVVLERTRETSDSRSLVRRISMGEIGMPGRDTTLKEQIREVASIKSFSLIIFSDGGGISRLRV